MLNKTPTEKFQMQMIENMSKFFKEMHESCESFMKNGFSASSQSKKKKSRPSPETGGNGKPKPKIIKDPNAPKKPPTAYILYFKDRKGNYGKDLPVTEITKIVGKEWREMPKEKQQYYLELSKKQQTKYKEEYDAYMRNKDVKVKPPQLSDHSDSYDEPKGYDEMENDIQDESQSSETSSNHTPRKQLKKLSRIDDVKIKKEAKFEKKKKPLLQSSSESDSDDDDNEDN